MLYTKAAKRNTALFAAGFLLCGLLHVALYGLDFAFCIIQLFCGVLTILWAISVRKRVTDDRLRFLMLGVAVCLILHFILQILRYDMFKGNITVSRYSWYAMYLPMMAQPVLCFYLVAFIHRPRDAPLPRRYTLILVPALFLALGVLTNDLHFGFTAFPSGILDDNGQEVRGWLLYLFYAFTYGLYALTAYILLKKDFRSAARENRVLPLIPLLILAIYTVLYPLDIGHRFFPCRLWNLGEMYAFCLVATLEACVQAGMIPANHGYEKLFSAADLPAVILDSAGNPVYQTMAAQYPFAKTDITKVVSHPIRGGSIEYLVDMEQVQALNLKLAEATQQIEARNAYLAEETHIKQERAELETRNRLYERISAIVQPQLEQIDALLNAAEGCEEKELARVAVLQAFIKRRGNMELLSASGILPAAELAAAVTESLDYVRLCGANTAASCVGGRQHPAAMVIAAYEQIEAILEKCLDTLSDMIIAIRSEQQRLTVRIMLKAESFSHETSGLWQDAGFSRRISITKEDQDMILVLTFTEGGERK